MSKNVWALHLALEHVESVEEFVANLNWKELSRDKQALPLLKKFPQRAHWDILSAQKWALPMLRQHPDRVNWTVVVSNGPWALPLLNRFPERANWRQASKYGWALPLVLENIDRLGTTPDAFLNGLDWSSLSRNQDALQLLKQFPERVQWSILSQFQWAHDLILMHKEKANWGVISEQFWAISLLEQHPSRILWKRTLRTPWSQSFVTRHFDEVDWYDIATTTKLLLNRRYRWVFEHVRLRGDCQLHHQFLFYLVPNHKHLRYSYARFKELRGNWLRKELAEFIYHPSRVERWMERNPGYGIEEM